MADPYSSVSITGYNSNPPSDDGSQVAANRVKWSTIKEKITDPVKARTDDMDTALIAAFAKMIGGAGITSVSGAYTVLSTDQGKLVRATNSGITITTPDATDVDAPFVFCLLNDASADITFDGNGSQTIDGDASVTVPPNCGLTVFTDGTNWFTTGQNFQRTLVEPQGYLTLVANTATEFVPTTDVSAATSVFYRPFRGNLIPIPDGANIRVREFAIQTLTLVAAHAANTILDVFGFDDNGTFRIGTGPAWATATAGSGARGTGAGTTELDYLKGLPVNKVAMTVRNGSTTYSVAARCGVYLGSLSMDGTNGQISCHAAYGQSRKWGVWNAFNRVPIFMKAGDATATWTYDTNTVRAANGAAANSLQIFAGLPEEMFELRATGYRGGTLGTNQSTQGAVGIGYNVTNAFSGQVGEVNFTNSTASNIVCTETLVGEYLAPAAIGIQNITLCERGGSGTAGTVTWAGTEAHSLLTARYRA